MMIVRKLEKWLENLPSSRFSDLYQDVSVPDISVPDVSVPDVSVPAVSVKGWW